MKKFFLVEVVFVTVVPRSSCCVSSSAGEFLIVLGNAASISLDNSLSAGFPTKDSLPSTAMSESPVTSRASSSWSPQLADLLTEAVVRAIGNSFPAVISSIQGNASSHVSSSVPGVSASGAPQVFFSLASASSASTSDGVSLVASGTFTLPAFVPMFTPVSAITVSCSACLVAPTPFIFVSPGVTSSLSILESSLASPKSEKAFIVGPGHAPIPSQLVSKIVSTCVRLCKGLGLPLHPDKLEGPATCLTRD